MGTILLRTGRTVIWPAYLSHLLEVLKCLGEAENGKSVYTSRLNDYYRFQCNITVPEVECFFPAKMWCSWRSNLCNNIAFFYFDLVKFDVDFFHQLLVYV